VSSKPADIRKRALNAHSSGDLTTAEALYRQLLASKGEASDAINLGALLRAQGRLKEASAHYHRWLEALPYNKGLCLNAANCFRDLKAHDQAVAVLNGALQHSPNDSQLLLRLGEVWLDQGALDRCHQLLSGLVQADPQLREAWVNLGVCAARRGDLAAALAAFEHAQTLDPSDGQMAANRITVLKDLGRLTDAEEVWKALPIPTQQQAGVRGALAGLRMAQNQFEEAASLYGQLSQDNPQEPVHWLNWAACLRGLKYTVAPHRVLQRGLQWHPQHWELQQALAQSLAEMGQPTPTLRTWQVAEDHGQPRNDAQFFSQQFLAASYGLLGAEQRAKLARQWESAHAALGIGRLWPDHLLEPLGERRLRVGYLSADYCNHPVGRFLLPVLEHHNREAMEVWALSCGPYDDWITGHLREKADHWIDLRFLGALQAARLVADQRLDVLVEVGGFTGLSRVELLVHRPAPVQLSYLGYPAPTYLEAVDGWIGDATLFGGLEGLDQTAHPLLEVPGGYMAFDPGGELPTPERCSAPRFRFGSFNHARKLTEASISLFCEVLAAVPEAELVLKSISFREQAEQERVRARFEAAGLAPERLVLLDFVEGGLNHLMRYSELDVALDPVPYGGATTTAEALWMGVPVVALAGAGMVGRLAASVLRHGNQGQWVANSVANYVAIAQALAAEGPRSAPQRLQLRQQVQASPLADGARLSSELERIYRQLRQAVRGL
jgi:protein O-GlcNAc transferase